MSYDTSDAAADDLYESIARELYPEHKVQAVGEFTAERLKSFYVSNPNVMRPAVDALQEGRRLTATGHPAAAIVFFGTSIELLLKSTLLKPIVHGLVLSPVLAEMVVDQAFGQTGFDRYTKLLSKLYKEFAGLELNEISRENARPCLMSECTALQGIRNKIIHQGASATADEAETGRAVAVAVYDHIVDPVLGAIGLVVRARGVIEPRKL
jgi:hypothetical protein